MIGRRDKAPRWLLPSSLVLNAFLGAVVAGHFWFRPPSPHGPPGPPHLIDEAARILPDADAEVLRQAFKAQGLWPEDGMLREEHEAKDRFIEALKDTLRQDPFDPHALGALLAAEKGRHDQRGEALIRGILAATSGMSAEGRRRLADWRGPPGPHGGPGGPPGGPDPHGDPPPPGFFPPPPPPPR